MQSLMQLMIGDLWDLNKLQIYAKGKSILVFLSVSIGIRKMQKTATEKKSTKTWFDRAALGRVYVYLISSTSMQKETPVANSVRQIKIRCTKYNFAERSHNFLMRLIMQLMFGDLWHLEELQICAKGKFISEFRPVSKGIRKMQKLQQTKKVPKNGLI